MMRLSLPVFRLLFAVIWLGAGAARSELLINEVLFNPPGSDPPNQYIELLGDPNLILSNGTYFVAVEGDTNKNPGTIKNVFDLSGRAIEQVGFNPSHKRLSVVGYRLSVYNRLWRTMLVLN